MWENVGNLRLLCTHVQIYMYFKVNVVEKLRPFEENAIIYFFLLESNKNVYFKKRWYIIWKQKMLLSFSKYLFCYFEKDSVN